VMTCVPVPAALTDALVPVSATALALAAPYFPGLISPFFTIAFCTLSCHYILKKHYYLFL
jgi:hypothetical protein